MKKLLILLLTIIMALTMAACGSSSDTSSQDDAAENGQAAEEETAEAAVHPYAWIGFQDMPECGYLNALAANQYYKESDMYIEGMSYVSKQINAVDGINSYKENENSKVWSIEGKSLSVNESSRQYMESDMSDLAENAKEQYKSAMESGTNLYGRELKGTGKEAVPIQEEDSNEYEYYEYCYPEIEASGDTTVIERYYLKDGDVYAIYNKTTMGDTVIESTEIIKKISEDIPEGTFDLPDLSDYEKLEL